MGSARGDCRRKGPAVALKAVARGALPALSPVPKDTRRVQDTQQSVPQVQGDTYANQEEGILPILVSAEYPSTQVIGKPVVGWGQRPCVPWAACSRVGRDTERAWPSLMVAPNVASLQLCGKNESRSSTNPRENLLGKGWGKRKHWSTEMG